MKAEPVLRVTDDPHDSRSRGKPLYIQIADGTPDSRWAALRKMADVINEPEEEPSRNMTP